MSGTGLMLDGWPDSPRTSDDFFGRRRKSNRFEPPKHLFCQTATRQQPSPLPSQRPRMATYSGTPRARPSLRNLASSTFSTTTPTMTRTTGGGGDIEVGDKVSVPGGMDGTVKFVGEIRGKQGSFVGVELSRQWAARGKNDGNVDGVSYFITSIPGAGIFLPINRAAKCASPASSGSIPPAPITPSLEAFSLHGQTNRSPSTPSIVHKFSQSVGPGRAPSPAFKPRSRPSLPRPESPLRRAQNAATMGTPGAGRPSLHLVSQNRLPGPRFAPSPTPGKMAPRPQKNTNGFTVPALAAPRTNGQGVSRDETNEIADLRAMVHEKNEKIAALTAEFDSHRADFRSTLDTLESASTETERVYEHRVEELLEERRVLMLQSEDVESVAHQLRQMEEVVQELEEGLEDARRGEAEARGEVEFLRGEVERVRAELRREREDHDRERRDGSLVPANGSGARKSSGGRASGGGRASSSGHADPDTPSQSVPGAEEGPPTTAANPDKWCALCEQDGHDSISCPFDRP